MATWVELWKGSASAQALRSPAPVDILTMKCAIFTGRVLLTTAMGFLLEAVSSCHMLIVLQKGGKRNSQTDKVGQAKKFVTPTPMQKTPFLAPFHLG